jgi:hypothetical protein
MSEIEKTPEAPKPPGNGAVRIKHVRFRTDSGRQGVIVASPKEAEDAIAARDAGRPNGYDIWFVPNRRQFRFDHYSGNKFHVTKWIPEANVFSFEEADQNS